MREDIEKQISDIHGNANILYVKRKIIIIKVITQSMLF